MQYVKISSKSADVIGTCSTVESWKERVNELFDNYTKDIWNLNDTGHFWKTLPDHGFLSIRSYISWQKTVALQVITARKRIVIGKSAKPRCQKSIDINNLPVSYFCQRKVWMMLCAN